MAARAIRILLADDHPITREPLRDRLNREPDLEVVGEAGDGEEAVYLAGVTRPDLIILDLSMPRMSGAQACQAISRAIPRARVVVLTGYAEHVDPHALGPLGAVGFVPKVSTVCQLMSVIRAVHRGETRLGFGRREVPPEIAIDAPTRRELEVVQMVAEGLHNKEIAERLAVRRKTVEYHLGNIRSKLAAHSRVELVQLARRHGWVV